MEKTSDILRKRKEKIEELKRDGINLYPNGFNVSDTIRDIQNTVEKSPQSLTEDDPAFVTAGRMMA
ncbi:MAG: lysine--tRNA ligase, partial [bacterium]|nr:lysine--tRNA ligase [bacterium]